MTDTLRRFCYKQASRDERGVLRHFLAKVTDLSRAQVTRCITQFLAEGCLVDRRRAPAVPFVRRYTMQDILLLAEMDALHGTLAGSTTRKLCERAFKLHGDTRFERLAGISNGHLYNLRGHQVYQSARGSFDKTRPAKVNIGERRKPFPEGRPGFLRVDSVHQGDRDGIKGVYLINAVDEVSQFQVICAVERITLKSLDAIAAECSDSEAAHRLNKARAKLFQLINKTQHRAA